MIGIKKQQKQKTVQNQRRTPLNVVVEKIGTARAVVHGDLSKESLKELLMSELSLISKMQTSEIKDSKTPLEKKSFTQGDSEIVTKGGKENISKKSKTQEEKTELNISREENAIESHTEQESNNKKNEKTISSDKEPFKKDIAKKGDKVFQDKEIAEMDEKQSQNKEKEKDDQQYQSKETVIEKDAEVEEKIEQNLLDNTEKEIGRENDVEGKFGKQNEIIRENKLSEGIEIAKKSEKKYRDEEIETLTKNNVNKGTKTTQQGNKDKETEINKKKFDKNGEKEYQHKEQATRNNQKDQKTKDISQGKRRKDSKSKERKFMSEKERRGLRIATTNEKDSRYYDDFGTMKQIEKNLDNEDFIEDYEKEDKESCFSKISSDQEDILNLSYDGKWLRQYLKKPLILAMNEIVEKKPKDPVNYLGFWLLNYRNSQENLQRKRDFEKDLLSKRNEWNVLQCQAEEVPELMIEEKESKHLEEEENIEDWNFSNYGFR